MSNVHYEADARRLRLEGALHDTDLDLVRDAVDTFAPRAGGRLTVDLTATTDLGLEVAHYLLETKAAAEAEGRRMELLRKLDTPADRALHAAGEPGPDTRGSVDEE